MVVFGGLFSVDGFFLLLECCVVVFVGEVLLLVRLVLFGCECGLVGVVMMLVVFFVVLGVVDVGVLVGIVVGVRLFGMGMLSGFCVGMWFLLVLFWIIL